MAKKQSTEVITNPRTSGGLEFSAADATAAEGLGIVIGGSTADRITRAVMSYNQAARLAVEAGYLLLSVKSDVAHGQFEEGVAALGLTSQRASELMRTAKFITTLPEDQRAEMLSLPRSKVLALASADPEVIAQMLEDGEVSDLDDMSVRGLRMRIRELEAGSTDLAVQLDKAGADLKAMEKKTRRAERDAEDDVVPMVVADVRAELAALVKKAELAIGSIYPLGVEVVGFGSHGDAVTWIDPTLRLGLSGLVALRLQLDGSIKSFVDALGEKAERLASQPDALSFLDSSEIKGVAEDWGRLTALHQHEAALREHERTQAKPKGKGRPASAPVAPAATGSKK